MGKILLEQFHKKNQLERVEFVTCPHCKRSIRADDTSHSAECAMRNYKPGKIEDDPIHKISLAPKRCEKLERRDGFLEPTRCLLVGDRGKKLKKLNL